MPLTNERIAELRELAERGCGAHVCRQRARVKVTGQATNGPCTCVDRMRDAILPLLDQLDAQTLRADTLSKLLQSKHALCDCCGKVIGAIAESCVEPDADGNLPGGGWCLECAHNNHMVQDALERAEAAIARAKAVPELHPSAVPEIQALVDASNQGRAGVLAALEAPDAS